MTSADVNIQEERIKTYHRLAERARAIHRALQAMEEPKVQNAGPFTGNTRESRSIERLQVHFTATNGGSPAITIDLGDLYIDANDFGRWLDAKLREDYSKVQEQIAKL